MTDKLLFKFSDGVQTKEKEFNRKNPFGFIAFMQRLPDGFKLVDVEGEGDIAEYVREQIKLKQEQGDAYQQDYNKLVALFLGGKS